MLRAGIVLLALLCAFLTWTAARARQEAAEAWRARSQEVEGMRREIEELERQLAAKNREVDDARRGLREAGRDPPPAPAPTPLPCSPVTAPRPEHPPERFSDEKPIPRIRGRIQAGDLKADVYVLSVGSKDGVETGDEFTISRGDRYVSTIVVDAVFPNHSAGHAKPAMRKSDIAVDDVAEIATPLGETEPPPKTR
jgi:hypothetical protein